ncbi:MAG: amino acid ABC transporter substrate-binding protein [Brevundimonas sp.]|uniref:amino acid ABC transporter substrate-binding protein n=1 Tax=Brevundimonas sp. TaxID=1871086 RepID=UPI00261E1A9A|nr:amino acid ABC transporter substrate-binding protein [Brevundimonas sp.]MDI6625524.1 amino acid ABC transporter substrate-binding protein [Brevundimonas sp.]MDQ7811686.1 amino acid ABC transporter substrate-binding protein [Brevundimonas sp.]
MILVLGLLAAACGGGDREAEAETTTVVAATEAPEFASPTLQAIKRRGRLNCGVHEGLVGFAYTDNRGEWRGFDADFCRALAAAVLGNPNAVRFVPLTSSQRFDALRGGRVDVLWRATSWTMSRDVSEGIRFAGVNYYDGQGFLVRRSLDLASAQELNGARVCVQRETTSELNVADFFRARGLEYSPVVTANEEAARTAYAREECDAFSADISALAAARTLLSNPEQHAILPDVISKEPLGPVVKRGDESWTSIVRWTLNALVLAEELGVTAETADQLAEDSRDPQIRRLLGAEGDLGPTMGLSREWAKNAIEASGNYGEIFTRNLGPDSSLDLARGLNAQWNARPGGLIYALPIR